MRKPSSRPEILLDARWLEHGGRRNVLGLARVGQEIVRRIPPLERLEGGLPLLHPAEPLWLTGVLGKRRPRLFYSPGFNAPPTSPVPFVFTIFDLIHLHINEESSVGKRLYYRLHVKPAVRRARAVLTGSEHSRADIVEWSGVEPERVVVIRSAAASSFTPHGEAFEPGYPYLLYVGNRKPHKNLARLVRALDRIDRGHALRLILPGPVEPSLASLAHDVGVGDRLVFLGQVADARLPALYRGALAFVFPSLHEGFGLPPLEAMASGVPVVASTAGALPEVLGDAALLVDVADLAGALSRIVDDDALRAALVARGRDRVAELSWDRCAAGLAAIYRDAAG